MRSIIPRPPKKINPPESNEGEKTSRMKLINPSQEALIVVVALPFVFSFPLVTASDLLVMPPL
jgi:hypothetical protein